MKTYLVVNPFSTKASHGIHNYNLNLISFLEKEGIKYDVLSNEDNLSAERFREYVKNYVEKLYGYDEVLIEAPEVKASTLLLDCNYSVHVRLHTPGAVAQKYDGAKINEELYSEELEAIENAKYVSAPSYGIINEIQNDLKRDDFSVYKNPFNIEIEHNQDENKTRKYDVVFMARFQKLKGIEFLNPILEKLPKSYKVLLFGNNSQKFKLSNKVSCQVDILDHIPGSERFELLKDSKHLLQLSKFENCSMVVLEGIACHCIVHAWDVGGNREIADGRVLKISPYGNVDYLVNQLLDTNIDSNKFALEVFEENLNDIHNDFSEGLLNIISNHSTNAFKPFKGLNKQESIAYNSDWLSESVPQAFSHTAAYNKFGKRIFGFSMSNEHIEEFWMPVIDKMDADYRFVCSRPLGFMYKFNNPYYVDPNKFSKYDWMRYPNILIKDIENFRPHKIFFHNGSHPMYYEVLNRIKRAFPHIPIVYSELGWFPQQDNVYFDTEGVNGLSSISKKNFTEFCGRDHIYPTQEKLKGHTVIITQLENDTNLIVNSNRFKSMEKFVEYCISKVPKSEEIIIKLHPLENYPERFERFESSRIKVVKEGDLASIIQESKAVIGINSTVLLESLQYSTNVYFFGQGVISNKGVAIDCTAPSVDLSEVWTEDLFASDEDRLAVINTFKSLQIYLPSLCELTVAECLELPSFKPLTTSVAKYTNGEEFQMLLESKGLKDGVKPNSNANSDIRADIQEIKDILNKMPLKVISQVAKTNNNNDISTFERKLRKLKKDPYRFFKDSNKTSAKIIAMFIGKNKS